MSTSLSASRPSARAALAVLAIGALSLQACASISDVQGSNRFGAITVSASGTTEGPFLAVPTATFFTGQSSDLPNSRTTEDQCGTFPYSPEAFTPGNISGGTALSVTAAGQSYQMVVRSGVPGIYAMDGRDNFPYEIGDSIRVTVPGVAGGFPASQIALRLAEPIRVQNELNIGDDQDLPISWETNGDQNSGVIISVRFTTDITSTLPDQQVLCIVRDNGAFTISGGQLGTFFVSAPASRSVNILRWRTNAVAVDERSDLYIVSTMDTTLLVTETQLR